MLEDDEYTKTRNQPQIREVVTAQTIIERLERGIDNSGLQLKSYQALAEVIPPSLIIALDQNNEAVSNATLDEREAVSNRDRRAGKSGYTLVEAEAFNFLVDHMRERMIKGTLKLLVIDGVSFIALSTVLSGNVNVIQLMKCAPVEFEYFSVQYLVLFDENTNRYVDLRSVIPSEIDLHYKPASSEQANVFNSVRQRAEDNTVRRSIRFGNLTTPSQLLTLLHEIGHLYHDSDLTEKDIRNRDEFKDQIMDFEEGEQLSISESEYAEGMRLATSSERNAWAYAIYILRELKRLGIDSAMETEEIVKLVRRKLISYRDNFSIEGTASKTRFYKPD